MMHFLLIQQRKSILKKRPTVKQKNVVFKFLSLLLKKINMQKYDIIIIGGGPIGLACALEAQNAGLTYLIIEKGALVNSLYNY